MEFTGKIIAVLPAREGIAKSTGNPWKVQEFVIENDDQYPKKMCFEVFGAEKIDTFNIQLGEQMTVSFDIDARQWQDRWFNSLRVWKVERTNAATADGGFVPPVPPADAPAFTESDSNDDLPF